MWAFLAHIAAASPLAVDYRRINCGEVSLSVGFAGAPMKSANAAVVFLHGFPDGSNTWHHSSPSIASLILDEMPNIHLVMPDLRGYNRSDMPPERGAYSIDKLSADVRGLILNITSARKIPVLLVAHDWGSAVAWYFSAEFPGLIDSLTCMDVRLRPSCS